MNQLEKAVIRLSEINVFNNVYGLARTSLALGTLSIFLFNDTDILFPFGETVGLIPIPRYFYIDKISLFHIFSDDRLYLARYLAIFILLFVASGWYPRFTGVLHCWVAYSFLFYSIAINGGDQLSAILTTLILPICLLDNRKWHWNMPKICLTQAQRIKNLIAFSCYWVIRIQLATLYFQAAVAKLAVEEWVNGTALYYWFTHPMFGASDWLNPVLVPMIQNPFSVVILTWMVMVFETFLFAAFFINRKYHKYILIAGISFHFGILLIHGLVSFFFAITGGLLIYLGPTHQGFNFSNVKMNLFVWKNTKYFG